MENWKRVWVRGLMIVIFAGGLFILGACSAETSSDHDRIQIVTTISQIGEPLSVIGGDRVDVKSLMGPGVDPHLYIATQGDIRTLQNADIVFYNGLYLEGNMIEIFEQIGKSKPVVAVADSIDENQLLMDEGAVDPHVWFDIDLWQQSLSAAVEAMKKFSPEHANFFEQQKLNYFKELEQLKQNAKKLAELPANQRVLVTAHDAFGYFGRMHNIEVVGLQGLSTEDEVALSDIQKTIHLLVERNVPAVFIESSISKDRIQAVIDGAAEAGHKVSLGGELFSDAMGAAGTEEGTYIGMYRHNVDTIYKALSKGE